MTRPSASSAACSGIMGQGLTAANAPYWWADGKGRPLRGAIAAAGPGGGAGGFGAGGFGAGGFGAGGFGAGGFGAGGFGAGGFGAGGVGAGVSTGGGGGGVLPSTGGLTGGVTPLSGSPPPPPPQADSISRRLIAGATSVADRDRFREIVDAFICIQAAEASLSPSGGQGRIRQRGCCVCAKILPRVVRVIKNHRFRHFF